MTSCLNRTLSIASADPTAILAHALVHVDPWRRPGAAAALSASVGRFVETVIVAICFVGLNLDV
jgi:hypothetical protein